MATGPLLPDADAEELDAANSQINKLPTAFSTATREIQPDPRGEERVFALPLGIVFSSWWTSRTNKVPANRGRDEGTSLEEGWLSFSGSPRFLAA